MLFLSVALCDLIGRKIMKTTRKQGIDQLNRDLITFSNKNWLSSDNKNLLNLIKDHRLNLAPCSLYGLDKLGLNHLEILTFSNFAGKKIHGLPSADIDFLNELEGRFNIIFGYEQKAKGQYIRSKVNHFCGSFTANGTPQFVSALFTLADLYN